MTLLIVLVIAAWITTLVFYVIWARQDKEFANFLSFNADRLRSGETCEFNGSFYNLNTRLVRYTYCCSILVMTYTRSSALRPVENSGNDKIICILLTLFGGWWGIPWGPIHSIKAFIDNASPKEITISEILNR
ncbi:MAG: hypothetical protein K2K57_06145 [Oscillospiraceae bacterium]|nr:hypothetical protein [Oscillospiraceae bacterium]